MRRFSLPRVLSRWLPVAALVLGPLGAVWACADDRALTAPPHSAGDTAPRLELTDVVGSNQPTALVLLNGPTKCLSLRDESGAHGTPVVVAPCAGAASERFTWTSAGELRAAVAGVSKCVTSNGTAGNAGDLIVLADCAGGANQRWSATAAGEIKGLNGRCLDVYDGAADGARTVLWDCYGATVSWQRWAARGGGRSVSFVSTTDPGKCLEVANNTTANGTWLIVNPCNGGADQRFTWGTNGEVRFWNGSATKCVTVQGAGTPGDVIMTWDCTGAATQRWQMSTAGEIRGLNGLCLDLSANAANGARAVLWTCYGAATASWQKWADRGTLSSAATCGVSFAAVVTAEDALLASYGVPATTDTVRVCETWTGNDYVVRETAVGSAPNAFRDPDTARTVVYSGGQVSGVAADGGPVHAPVDVGPTAFDFMQVDSATRRASFDDPYYAVYASDGGGCGTQIQCSVGAAAGAALPAGAGVSRSVAPDTGKDARKFAKHGLKRRGVRALVEDAEEVGRSPEGHRRFRKRRGAAEVVLTLDKDTELLVGEETANAEGTTKAKHTWKQHDQGGYVRERTEVETVETVGGRTLRSRTTITLADVALNTDGASPASPSTLRSRTPR